jgi:hypothetical protein
MEEFFRSTWKDNYKAVSIWNLIYEDHKFERMMEQFEMDF